MEAQLEQLIQGLEQRAEPAQETQNLKDILSFLAKIPGAASQSTRKRTSTAAVEEFCKLQDSFAYNLCGRLVRLLDSQAPTVLVLQCIRGCCLLHRPSRLVFDSDTRQRQVLQLAQRGDELTQIAAVNTFCAFMVRQVDNIRRFERLDGLKTVAAIFKHKDTSFKVKRAILEFLFFYLVPESTLPKADRKTTAEKQVILGRYLSNVDNLARELEDTKPFGTMDLNW